METIGYNQSKKLTLGPGKYKGIYFGIFAVVNTTNTAFGASANETFDFSGVNVKISRICKGDHNEEQSEEEIGTTDLRNLVMLSEYDKPSAEFILDKTKADILLAHGVGVAEQVYIPLKYRFTRKDDIIHVQHNENLIVEVFFGAGAFGSDISTAATYMEVDGILGHGVELFTPKFKTITIDPADTNDSFSIPNNAMAIGLFNYDKTDALLASQVVQTSTLSGKHNYRRSDTFISLLTKIRGYFASEALAALRLQSYMLHDANDEHDCLEGGNLQLNLKGSNVNASKNFIAIQYYTTSNKVVSKAHEEAHKKQAAFDAKGSIDPKHVGKDMGHILPPHLQPLHAAVHGKPVTPAVKH